MEVGTSPSQDYGEWLRSRREEAELSREQLAAAAGVSAIQIYNIETGRTINPRPGTREALERALHQPAPTELVRAVEESAEIRGVGRMTDFDPHSEEDFPLEPGVYCCTTSAIARSTSGKPGTFETGFAATCRRQERGRHGGCLEPPN